MAYFAKIEDGIVVNVIVADQAFIDAGHVEGTWLETTFGALGGIVYVDGKPTDLPSVRKNYAGIGNKYDLVLDAFIVNKPYPSWILNESNCLWEPPIPYPADGAFYAWNEDLTQWNYIAPYPPPDDGKLYEWDEATISWKELPQPLSTGTQEL
jgi:hypothetical protein